MPISDQTIERDRYQFQKVQYCRFRKTVLIYRFEIHIENAIFSRSCLQLVMFGETVIVEAEENA